MVILSYSRYCRYRTLLRRLDGPKRDLLIHKKFVQDALLELGIPMQRNNRVNILFCRDSFDHEALALNELNCDHLGKFLCDRYNLFINNQIKREYKKQFINGSLVFVQI